MCYDLLLANTKSIRFFGSPILVVTQSPNETKRFKLADAFSRDGTCATFGVQFKLSTLTFHPYS